MLDLLKSGVGLSLVRDSIAIRESQAHGLVLADRVRLDCALRFVSLAARRDEPVIASAWDALAWAWNRRLTEKNGVWPYANEGPAAHKPRMHAVTMRALAWTFVYVLSRTFAHVAHPVAR